MIQSTRPLLYDARDGLKNVVKKYKMKAKLENGEIIIYSQLPNTYGNVQNGYASLTERHEADGFLDLITPELLDNEILGEVYQIDNYFTYHKIYVEPKTPEEIAQQQIINLKQKETDLYIKRIQDAQRIWAGLSAEFRIAKQVGQMDDATENIILAELKPVLDIVVPFGQWKTGYQLLLGIGSSVIGEDLYNKLHDILWNYIQENYEEMEIELLKINL